MSKYERLWEAVSQHGEERVQLTFAEIEAVLGFPMDHSFLNFKKELVTYGWQMGTISVKTQTVCFNRCTSSVSEVRNTDTLFFFDGKPDGLALYKSLVDKVTNAVPEFAIKVQKSQIGFYNRHLFAMVSLPRRKAQGGIVVSFGLDHLLNSPRVAVATEPYPNRWTHHVSVTDTAQMDDELLYWLREAYDFAGAKLR